MFHRASKNLVRTPNFCNALDEMVSDFTESDVSDIVDSDDDRNYEPEIGESSGSESSKVAMSRSLIHSARGAAVGQNPAAFILCKRRLYVGEEEDEAEDDHTDVDLVTSTSSTHFAAKPRGCKKARVEASILSGTHGKPLL